MSTSPRGGRSSGRIVPAQPGVLAIGMGPAPTPGGLHPVGATSATSPRATGVRRPMCEASRSTWIVVASWREPPGYGSPSLSMSRTSAPSNATLLAGVADQPALADRERVVVLEPLLGLQREHHRRCEPVGQREQVVSRVDRAPPCEDRHRAGFVDRADRLGEQRGSEVSTGLVVTEAQRASPSGTSKPPTSPGRVRTRPRGRHRRRWTACSMRRASGFAVVTVGSEPGDGHEEEVVVGLLK